MLLTSNLLISGRIAMYVVSLEDIYKGIRK